VALQTVLADAYWLGVAHYVIAVIHHALGVLLELGVGLESFQCTALEFVRLILRIARSQRGRVKGKAVLIGIVLGYAPGHDNGNLVDVLKLSAGDHILEIRGVPVLSLGRHCGNLPHLVAERLLGLGIDAALRDPVANRRRYGKGYDDRSHQLAAEPHPSKHGSSLLEGLSSNTTKGQVLPSFSGRQTSA